MITLDLPYPPSVWNLYTGWGKGRRLSPEYIKWRQSCAAYIMAAGIKAKDQITTPFQIDVKLKRENKRQDLDNRCKAILDALQHYGVIRNDNLCEAINMKWADQTLECVITIATDSKG